jgi:hypothetical protein
LSITCADHGDNAIATDRKLRFRIP